jgi:hypothetical protein
MIDDRLLADFMNGFHGFGTYDGRYWFIGMEPGGGESEEDIARRLEAWDRRGRPELDDVAEYHALTGHTRLFDEKPKLQSTWKGLMMIALAAEGQPAGDADLQAYQRDRLGRPDGETCLLELLPLSSPNTGRWLYGSISAIPYLKDRKTYRARMTPVGVRRLARAMALHRPEVVVFYSRTYRDTWKEIAGPVDWQTNEDGVEYARRDGTLLVITHHPAAWGVPWDHFTRVGRFIAAQTAR